MVKMVVMTVWIHVQVVEKVKDQDVDEAHGKNQGVQVYSKPVLVWIDKSITP